MRALLLALCLSQAAAGPVPRVYTDKDPGVVLPRVISERRPSFPGRTQSEGIEGVIIFALVVDTDGRPTRIRMTKSLDARYGLDRAARKAVEQWRFKPATKDGVPIPMEVTVELSFFTVPRNARKVYGDPKDVSSIPEPLIKVIAPYTPAAIAAKAEGEVVLEGTIEKDGTVGDYQVVTGIHPELDDSAIHAFTSMKFKPAIRAGKPVPYRITIRYLFTLPKHSA